MKRILITGAAGFVYSNVADWILTHRNYEVTCLDRLDEAGTLRRVAGLKDRYPDRFHVVWHDLRAQINPSHEPGLEVPFDMIVHGAACSHVDRAIKNPPAAVLDNVLGTAHLLEYVRHHQPQAKTLVVSTDEVFGPAPEGVEFGEHARFEPENAYASAKAGGELLAPAYAHQYGLRICVTRCANIYGSRGPEFKQYKEKFIPICIERISAGNMVQIHARGGVSSSRLYIHVDDVASATLTVLEKGGVIAGPASGRYNIVAQREWSNLEVAEKLAALMGRPLHYELVENPPGRPKPDMRYALRGDKLKALGWEPRIGLDEGLRSTVEHYLEAQSSHVVLNSAPANENASRKHG